MGATHGKKGIVYAWDGTGSNLTNEACGVADNDAQISDSAKRFLNPNSQDLTFTPTNAVNLESISYFTGYGHFNGPPGVTTCSGTGAYIAAGNISKVGYLYEWNLDFGLDVDEISAFQDDWKSHIVGQAGAQGGAEGYFVGTTWWDILSDHIDDTAFYYLLQLFSYDPDDDQTGDHWNVWASLTGLSVKTGVSGVVKESIGIQVHGEPVFVPNS